MLITNAQLATMDGPGRYGRIENGALAVKDERIVWAGAMDAIPAALREGEVHDLQGRLVTPGLIDCHTHLVFGGNRAVEFEMRLEGASYEDIARAGGGILSTVTATRAAPEADLLRDALRRVDTMMAQGVTTLEIKSGYGLEMESELKMLRVARRIGQERPVTVRTSFLGAHAVPPEFAGRADAYIDEIVLPTLASGIDAGLIDAVDGFCEGIAFDPAQIARVFEAARGHGLPVKLHAEQLSHLGGAVLASRFGALSADHLEHANEVDARAMAAAGTVAVLLPGAFYTLREMQIPPIAALRAQNVAMALATDCNPGSSPLYSLLLAMNMGCTLFRLTPEEALAGVTCHAARALGLEDRGTLAAGRRADLAVWDVESPAELAYRIGDNPLHESWIGGVRC